MIFPAATSALRSTAPERNSPFAFAFRPSGLFQNQLALKDYPGVSTARGMVAFVPVPVTRLPPPPAGYTYVSNQGMALVLLDSFLNVHGRANGYPAIFGTQYPEIMPTVLVQSRTDGHYFQFTPEMHVDGASGAMGIWLDRVLGFGFNKQSATVKTDEAGSRFDVTGRRGSYSVTPSAQGAGASAQETFFWDTMASKVPVLGSRGDTQPRSLFNRALPDAWDKYGERSSQTAIAIDIRGDGLRHLGIEPGVYPGLRYQRFQGLTYPWKA